MDRDSMDMGTIEMFKCLINNTKYNNYNINHFSEE